MIHVKSNYPKAAGENEACGQNYVGKNKQTVICFIYCELHLTQEDRSLDPVIFV